MTEQEKKDVIHALETLAHHKKIGGACELCAKTAEFALELLKEQQKKEIKLIKRHTFSLGRTDEFSMRKLYEIICETLMDEGQLVISRTDDHEKVNFVWEIRSEET